MASYGRRRIYPGQPYQVGPQQHPQPQPQGGGGGHLQEVPELAKRNLPLCPSCQSRFTVKDTFLHNNVHAPHLLNCGHSECSACIQRKFKEEKKVECSTCHTVTDCPSGKENESHFLPYNHYLIGQLVRKRSNFITERQVALRPPMKNGRNRVDPALNGSSTKGCGECSVEPATLYCYGCHGVYCYACNTKVHAMSKVMAKHNYRALEVDEKISLLEDFSAGKCPDHKEERLTLYCEDCEDLACTLCIGTAHKKHDLKSLKVKNEEYIPQLSKALEGGNLILNRILKTEAQLNKLKAKNMPQLHDIEKDVESHFAYLHGLLDVKENLIKSMIQTKAQEYIHHWEMLVTELGENKNYLLNLIKIAKEAKKDKHETLNVKDVHDRLTKIRNLHCCLVSDNDGKGQGFIAKLNVNEAIEDSIQNCVSLETTFQVRHSLVVDTSVPDIHDMDIKDSDSSFDRFSSASSATDGNISKNSGSKKSNNGDDMSAPVYLIKTSDGVRTLSRDEQFLIGTHEQVLVTHVTSPSQFYVQSVSQKREAEDMGIDLQKLGNCPTARESIPENIEIGSLYLVQYSEDCKWYRGRVIRRLKEGGIEGDAYEVFYIDYGNSEVVPHGRFRGLPKKFLRLHPKCMECCLWELLPSGGNCWSSRSQTVFAELVKATRLLLTIVDKTDGVLQVDVLRMPDHDIKGDYLVSVRDSLIFMEVAKYKNAAKIEKPLGYTEVPKFLKPEHDYRRGTVLDVVVTHVTSPSLFYVQQVGKSAQYHKQMQDSMQTLYGIENSFERWPVYAPKEGMVCACLYTEDNLWYRAQVLSLPGNSTAEVLYVDYGNTEVVSWRLLRKLVDKYLKPTIQALRCSLIDIAPTNSQKEWPPEARRSMSTASLGRVLNMHIENVRADYLLDVVLKEHAYNGSVYIINALLVQQNVAEPTGPNAVCTELTKLRIPKCPMKRTSPPRKKQHHTSGGGEPCDLAPSCTLAPKPGHGASGDASRPKERHPSDKVSVSSVPTANSTQNAQLHAATVASVEVPIEVNLSYCESPSLIYVQESDMLDELAKLKSVMDKYYNRTKDETQNWDVGQFVAIRYLSYWWRARVVEPGVKKIRVFLVDKGDTISCSSDKLRVLRESFLEPDYYAIRCHLAGIIPTGGLDTWSSFCKDELEKIVSDFNTTFVVKKGDLVEVPGIWGDKEMSLPIDLRSPVIFDQGAIEPRLFSEVSVAARLLETGLALPLRMKVRQQHTSPTGTKASAETFSTASEDIHISSGSGSTEFQSAESSDTACIKDIIESGLAAAMDRSDGGAASVEAESAVAVDVRTASPAALPTAAALSPSDDRIKAWKKASPPTETRLNVIVTYIDDKAHIYVQDIEKSEAQVQKMNDDLHEAFKSTPYRKEDKTLDVGDPCIAKYHHTNKWYRAVVVKISPNDVVDIRFVDYGNEEVVNRRDLRRKLYFTDIPEQCWECELVGIEPNMKSGQWPTKVIEVIHEMIVDKPATVIIHEVPSEGPLKVILLRYGGMNLAQMLMSMNVAKPTLQWNEFYMPGEVDNVKEEIELPEEDDDDQIYTDFLSPNIPESERVFTVTVTHVASHCEVFFGVVGSSDENASDFQHQMRAQSLEFVTLTSQLQEEAPKLPRMSAPMASLPCCARYDLDERWYRCLILQVSGEEDVMVNVQYVDYGNSDWVSGKDVKILPNKWRQLPAQAIHTRLMGLEPRTGSEAKAVVARLKECLQKPGMTLAAKVMEFNPLAVVLYPNEKDMDYLAYQELYDEQHATVANFLRRHTPMKRFEGVNKQI